MINDQLEPSVGRSPTLTIPTNAPAAFHILAKPAGAICNLDCKYCFFLSKEMLYPGSRFRMADELLEAYIRQTIQGHRVPEVIIAWQGGEPTLMGLDFFRRSIEYEKKYQKPGMEIQNTIQTNGTLLDDEWCQFFRENNFLVGLSLDGPRPMHDAYRVDKGGRPTFDKVMRAARLMQQHQVDFNILCTVHTANQDHPVEVYRFFRDEVGVNFIQFIPIVEREIQPALLPADSLPLVAETPHQTGKGPLRFYMQQGNAVTDRSCTAEGYGNFLNGVFDEWVRHDVGTMYVQLFDVSLASWVGVPNGLCVHSETCGAALALEHNGDLYSCDHFVEPKYLLGNILKDSMIDLISSDQQRKFGLDKREALPNYCRECSVRFACHGGCPKDRFIETPDGEPGLNYLCAGFKLFFNHIDRPMRIMTDLLRQNRAPAEIMQILAKEEAGQVNKDDAGAPRRRHKPKGKS